MKKMILLTVMVLGSVFAFAEDVAPAAAAAKPKEEMKAAVMAQADKIKEACAADIATTGCTGEKRELMKCAREYKKANKDFKFSDSCKEALKEGHKMRKDLKEMRKAKKAAKEETK